jgi:hypothetical protein
MASVSSRSFFRRGASSVPHRLERDLEHAVPERVGGDAVVVRPGDRRRLRRGRGACGVERDAREEECSPAARDSLCHS